MEELVACLPCFRHVVHYVILSCYVVLLRAMMCYNVLYILYITCYYVFYILSSALRRGLVPKPPTADRRTGGRPYLLCITDRQTEHNCVF